MKCVKLAMLDIFFKVFIDEHICVREREHLHMSAVAHRGQQRASDIKSRVIFNLSARNKSG